MRCIQSSEGHYNGLKWRYVLHLILTVQIWGWSARHLTPRANLYCLSLKRSDSFQHSSFRFLGALLKSIYQPVRFHPNTPSLPKDSGQGFQILLSLVTAGLLSGHLCCRALQGTGDVHCLVAGRKNLCCYICRIWTCNYVYLRLWNGSLYFRFIQIGKPRFSWSVVSNWCLL